MITKTNTGNFYDWKNEEHKPFFAIYTNLACLNLVAVLDNISSIVLKKKSETTEGKIEVNHLVIKALKKPANDVQQKKIIELLDKWLPFVTTRTSEPNDMANRLNTFSSKLVELRNYYSHYHCQKKPFNFIADKVKKNIENIKGKLDELYKKASEDVKKRHETVPKSSPPLSTEFTENAFLFFLSLFLQKRQMVELLNHTYGKKNTTTLDFKINRDFYHRLNAKPPQTKLETSRDKESFTLNLINELSRLPKNLKPYLEPEHAKKLFVKEDSFLKKDKAGEMQEDVRTVEMIRHNDSFSYQALQFFEVNDLFQEKQLQFQINLGKIYKKEPYEKVVFDQTLNRELRKNIITYDKLNNCDREYFKEHINREKVPPECSFPLAFYSPKYHFHQNRFGLKIGEPTKVTIEDSKNTLADFIITEKALPHLVYLFLLEGEGKVFYVLKNFKCHFKNFLSDISKIKSGDFVDENDFIQSTKEKYNIKRNWIPKKILDYFSEKDPKNESLSKKAEAKIKAALNEVDYLLEGEKKSKNKVEERKKIKGFFHFSFKKGDKADWLANDINTLKPAQEVRRNGKLEKEKLNPGNMNVLQAKIAFLGKDSKDMKALFKELGLIDHQFQHPFLDKVDLNPPTYKNNTRTGILGIKSFFVRYLTAKQKWLKEQKSALKNTQEKDLKKTFYYLKLKTPVNTLEALKGYASNLLEKHPLYVPIDLFDEAILQAKGEDHDKNNTVDWHILQDMNRETQWFYQEGIRTSTDGLEKFQKYQRYYRMRDQQIKDYLCWRMIQETTKGTDFENAFKNKNLSNFTAPESEIFSSTNILNQQVEMKITITPADRYIRADKEYTLKGKRKLRDHGAFRYLLKDKRLYCLLSYYKDFDFIKIDRIIEELNYLENNKLEVLKKTFLIEKGLKKKDPKKFENLKKEDNGAVLFRTLIQGFFDKENENGIECLITFRNKLLHNELPLLPCEVTNNKDDENPKLVTEQLLDYGNEVCEKRLREI